MSSDRDKWDGVACKAVFKAIAKVTYEKYMDWFREHPEEPWCYWGKDEPVKAADRDNKEILAKHPEIEDIDDHTTVRMEAGEIVMRDFCPRLRKSLGSMLEGKDSESFTSDGLFVTVSREGDNYRVSVTEE